jgi:hypothetical protein
MDFSSPYKAAQSLVRRLQQLPGGTDDQQLLLAAQRLVSALATKTTTTTSSSSSLDALETPCLALLAAPAARWECLCAALLVATEALQGMGPARTLSPALRDGLYAAIAAHLEHPEPRLRALVARALGALCSVPALGVDAYLRFRPQLWGLVDAQLHARAREAMPTTYGAAPAVALDDVTGWRALETALLTLVAVANACGPELARGGHVDAAWLERAVFAASAHPNRYVREAGMGMCRALVAHGGVALEDAATRARLAEVVAGGLADAWPQVVYAAVKAARALLVPAGAAERAAVLFPALLPRLCLSRYYVPEGVQALAQEAWEALFGAPGGKAVVAGLAAETVACYCAALAPPATRFRDGHFARIAACYAVKELASKVELAAVAPYAERLLAAVLPCLGDAHWEVRAAGCVALAQLAQSFPAVACARRAELVAACLARLADESWSIREEAALALAGMARSFAPFEAAEAARTGTETEMEMETPLRVVLAAHLAATLGAARSQPSETKEAQQRRFNDPGTHTGRAAFGCCGGLEQPGRQDGDGDGEGEGHAYHYEAQPWEVSEGALYLLRELCAPDLLCPSSSASSGASASASASASAFADECLPLVAELGRLAHFPDHARLQQSVWKVLPECFARLGKPVLKRHLELFTPGLLAALASPLASPLARHIALGCLEQLSAQLGKSIFLGRLSEGERGLFLHSCSALGGAGVGAAAAAAAGGGASGAGRPSVVSM